MDQKVEWIERDDLDTGVLELRITRYVNDEEIVAADIVRPSDMNADYVQSVCRALEAALDRYKANSGS